MKRQCWTCLVGRGWERLRGGYSAGLRSVFLSFLIQKTSFISILFLYYDERRDIPWNIVWARGKYQGQIPKFPEGSVYISPYILTRVIIQTFSISKSHTSSIVLPCRAILKELIFHISNVGPYRPSENSAVAALGNTHAQESNARKVKYQYYSF